MICMCRIAPAVSSYFLGGTGFPRNIESLHNCFLAGSTLLVTVMSIS